MPLFSIFLVLLNFFILNFIREADGSRKSLKIPAKFWIIKMRGRGSKDLCFCLCLGYKNCPRRGWGKGVKMANSVHLVVECTLIPNSPCFSGQNYLLKSVYFKKTVAQSSFLSKVLSFFAEIKTNKKVRENDNTFERNESS